MIEGSLGSSEHGIQLGSLGNSSGESIKDEPVRQPLLTIAAHRQLSLTIHLPILAFLVRSQFIPNHTNHDLITDQISPIHDLLGLFTKISLSLNLRSKHISSSKMTDTVLGRNVGCLGSFSYTCQLVISNTEEDVPAPGGPMRTILGAPATAPVAIPTAFLAESTAEETALPVLVSSWTILSCSWRFS
jgi:hypothetical protein